MRWYSWAGLMLGALGAWGLVWMLIVQVNVGSVGDFFALERVVAYIAFVVAPLLTFMPIARALSIPLYDLESVVAWSTLLFVVTFINPGQTPPFPVLLLFLITLMMSLATLFTLISYAIGYRLLTRRSQRYDFLRARREGYLAAMFLVGILLLHLLEVLTIVNGALLALIIVLLEVFLLSRGGSSGERRSVEQIHEPGHRPSAP
jgi:hypothetical protein